MSFYIVIAATFKKIHIIFIYWLHCGTSKQPSYVLSLTKTYSNNTWWREGSKYSSQEAKKMKQSFILFLIIRQGDSKYALIYSLSEVKLASKMPK